MQSRREIAAEATALKQSLTERDAKHSKGIVKYSGLAGIDELTAGMLSGFIRRVRAYPCNALEVRLSLTDEFEALKQESPEDCLRIFKKRNSLPLS